MGLNLDFLSHLDILKLDVMVGFCAALLEKNMIWAEYTSPETTPFDDISGMSSFKCLSHKIFLTKQEFLLLNFLPLFKVIFGTRNKKG